MDRLTDVQASGSIFRGPRNDFLQMQHGSLYPALHRLEERGWVSAKWETAPDKNREFKYYRLTEKGRKQYCRRRIAVEANGRCRCARVMWPAAEEELRDEMVANPQTQRRS